MSEKTRADLVVSLMRPAAPNVIPHRDYVSLPGGLSWRRPTTEEMREADRLTAEQEKIYNAMEGLRPSVSEEDSGRYLSMCRKIADLESRKHPLLKTWNRHLWR